MVTRVSWCKTRHNELNKTDSHTNISPYFTLALVELIKSWSVFCVTVVKTWKFKANLPHVCSNATFPMRPAAVASLQLGPVTSASWNSPRGSSPPPWNSTDHVVFRTLQKWQCDFQGRWKTCGSSLLFIASLVSGRKASCHIARKPKQHHGGPSCKQQWDLRPLPVGLREAPEKWICQPQSSFQVCRHLTPETRSRDAPEFLTHKIWGLSVSVLQSHTFWDHLLTVIAVQENHYFWICHPSHRHHRSPFPILFPTRVSRHSTVHAFLSRQACKSPEDKDLGTILFTTIYMPASKELLVGA